MTMWLAASETVRTRCEPQWPGRSGHKQPGEEARNRRDMNPPDYYEHERPEVLEAVPRDSARVLDVGCGSGRLGEQIKRRQGATVWGIEVMRDASERAAQRLDRVWNTPVETALPEIPEENFDCIITADVLEH